MRSACQVNQFTTQFTFFTSTKVQILTLTRLAETWEQDFELAVLQTGMAHLLIMSREFDFVGAASYSDTHEAPHLHPQAQRRGDRGDRGGDCRAGGASVCSSHRGAAESSRAEHSREPHSREPHSQNAAKGGKKGGEREEEDVREESERGPPEVGQLMFAMPGRLVERGSNVKVRVAHGANGFTAFLLP